MRDRDLQRYSRHILLPPIDIAGQQRQQRHDSGIFTTQAI